MADKNKILGCLVGAAAGDAMGAATELRTRQQIENQFGGYVTDFLAPPDDTFARGSKAGQITDDFSVAYITNQEIIRQNGLINDEVVKKALLDWSEIDEYFSRFAGPTTRSAISEMKGVKVLRPEGFDVVNDNAKATNGGAMKSAPVALFSNGDIDKAIDISVTLCMPTHPNNISISSASAIAAATAAAMKPDSSFFDVVQAGLYGARRGDELGREKAHTFAGASVEKRIKLAILLATVSEDISEAIDKINDYIGSGLMAVEAVPAVFGLIVAAKGDTVKGIEAAVNIGNDTDTVATMVGGVLGTLNGADTLPIKYLEILQGANNIDLEKMADDIAKLLT
ncbi:MAG: ADP-ribosylglycohydrolase family protein [Sporomusa sp.]